MLVFTIAFLDLNCHLRKSCDRYNQSGNLVSRTKPLTVFKAALVEPRDSLSVVISGHE